MKFLDRLFGRADDERDALRPLWNATVDCAREPHWYVAGGVPDTLDGRFDMVALVLAQVLLRIEDAPRHAQDGVWLTEIFVHDMDGQMRQIGFGDMIVGKQIGRIMSALGGRLGAYRAGADNRAVMEAALVRNLYRGDAPAPEALAHVVTEIDRLRLALAVVPVAELVKADRLPTGGAA